VGALHLITSAAPHPATDERVRYAYRIRLIGTDTSGIAFEDEVKTELVTRDGALLVSGRSLPTDATMFMRRDGRLVQARVLGQVGLRQDEYLYGMLFVGSQEGNFWDVVFPDRSLRDTPPKLLECSRCSRQDAVLLREIEKVVFEFMQGTPRQCTVCAQQTLWIEPPIPGEAELVTGSASYEPAFAQQTRTPNALAINRRKHMRVAMKNVKACLQRLGFADDVVKVVDLSRGGIRFLSEVDYRPGTELSVSVPFTPGGSNVFSPARVVRVQTRPKDGVLGEFGLQYVK
jgi:hypothetical protein